MNNRDLILFVVSCNQGSKVLKYAQKAGARGGTILMGQAATSNPIVKTIGYRTEKKELVLIVTPHEDSQTIFDYITKTFKFHEAKRGVGMILPLALLWGTRYSKGLVEDTRDLEEKVEMDYRLVMAILEEGAGQGALEAVEKTCVTDGLILKAHGASSAEAVEKVFGMEIDRSREALLILTKKDRVNEVTQLIRKACQLDTPGSGIILSMHVSQVSGLLLT